MEHNSHPIKIGCSGEWVELNNDLHCRQVVILCKLATEAAQLAGSNHMQQREAKYLNLIYWLSTLGSGEWMIHCMVLEQ